MMRPGGNDGECEGVALGMHGGLKGCDRVHRHPVDFRNDISDVEHSCTGEYFFWTLLNNQAAIKQKW